MADLRFDQMFRKRVSNAKCLFPDPGQVDLALARSQDPARHRERPPAPAPRAARVPAPALLADEAPEPALKQAARFVLNY